MYLFVYLLVYDEIVCASIVLTYVPLQSPTSASFDTTTTLATNSNVS